jgi:hypothetical protein
MCGAAGGLLLSGWVIRHVSGLYPLDLPAHPYFVAAHAPLLYFLLPLAFAGTVVMFLAPGTLIVSAVAPGIDVTEAVLKGFLVSLIIVAILSLAVARIFTNSAWPLSIALLVVTAFAWRGGPSRSTLTSAGGGHRLMWVAAFPAIAVVVFLPVIFWQDLNPDGGEMLSMARSLDHYLIPRVPSGELSGLGLGMVAAAYPSHFFYLLGGITEAAPRLPMLLYLPVLFCGMVAAIETCHGRRLRPVDEMLLALGVSGVLVALIYNASYHAYSADAASPAAIDVLAAICLLGMIKAFAERERGWFFAFAAVGYFVRPIAVLACVLLIAAQLLLDRRSWRRTVPVLVAAIVMCVFAAAVYERGIARLLGAGLVEPSTGVGGRRLRYLMFADWRRLAYVAVPTGIVPLVTLVLFGAQDLITRTWAVLVLLFLAFFWFPAFSALHHYLPAVLLSMVVFWRMAAAREPRGLWQAGALVAAIVAVGLSLPTTFAVDRSSRRIGAEIDFRIGDYLGGPGAFHQAFEGKRLIESLFPGFERAQPDRELMSSPLMFVHYSALRGTSVFGANYLVLPPGEIADPSWSLVDEQDVGTVWVRNRERWQSELRHPPSTAFRSRLLNAPRETLLPTWGVPVKHYDIDLKAAFDALKGRR